MQWNELKSHIRHIDTKDQKRIQEAFELGKKMHRDQKRKSGEAFFMHPIAVTHILADMGADADTLVAALLHDTVEDTDLTLKQIDKQFDGSAATLIDGVTKLEPEDVADKPTLDGQIETLRKMFTLLEQDVRVMIIKLADRLHNMQTIEHLSDDRQKLMAQETLDVFVKLAYRLSMLDVCDELEGMCIAVLQPKLHKELISIQEESEGLGAKAIKRIETKLKTEFSPLIKKIGILYEAKSWGKLQAQYNSKNTVVTGITDITCVFTCDDEKQCYEILGALHHFWPREALSFQDFINSPMINGYQGIHTTIILADGTRVRCKIRTWDMHHYAREGVASLCFDSEAIGLLEYLPWAEYINTISNNTTDQSQEFWESLQSDILGESIVLHGPNDERILLPKGATALDGALYLFEERGLKVMEITVNGIVTPFYEELPFASSLSATFHAKNQSTIKWLQYTKTHIATARIRKGLSKTPRSQKREIGKALLAASVEEKAMIGLDELDAKTLEATIKKRLGIDSIEKLYEHIAEGKYDPVNVVQTLFPTNRTSKDPGRKRLWILKVCYPTAVSSQVSRIIQGSNPENISYKNSVDESCAKARFHLCANEANTLQTQLLTVLKTDQWKLYNLHSRQKLIGAIFILLMLWGLDPLAAEYLLSTKLQAVDLIIIRFTTFFIGSALIYGAHQLYTQRKYKPLKLFQLSLISSGIALFLTGTLSYFALSYIQSTEYILFIIAGLVLVQCIKGLYKHESPLQPCSVLLLLLLSIGILTSQHSIDPLGILCALGSSISFAFYSVLSARYQKEVKTIQGRYPSYLFLLSTIALPLSLLFIPFSTIHTLPIQTLIVSGVFVFIFTALPYGIYFECMRRLEKPWLDLLLPFVMVWTIIGGALFHRSYSELQVAPLVSLAIYLLWRQRSSFSRNS